MIWVRRSSSGEVVAVSREADVGDGHADWSVVADDDPELAAFVDRLGEVASPLAMSDRAFIRVLEDLIDLLTARSVILFTDLPPAAQAKLLERRSARAAMYKLDLLDDPGDETL